MIIYSDIRCSYESYVFQCMVGVLQLAQVQTFEISLAPGPRFLRI